MPTLTPKQAAFCREYVKDYNATQAAIRAGYAHTTARQQAARLLTKVDISEELQRLQTEAEERSHLTVAWTLKQLEENVNRAMQATPVYRKDDGEWVETGEWEYQGNVANKALELIGKHLGMFTDKVENTHKFDGIVGIDVHMPKPDD